jgi:PD-(D/E)XK nuclease superfamily
MENRLEVLNCHARDNKKMGLYWSVSEVLDFFTPFPRPNKYMREQIVLGSELHKDIEDFYNGIKCNKTNADFFQFTNFAEYAKNILDIEPYRTEWKVYDDDFKLSGTIDMIFRKKNDPSIFYLYDWKRSIKQGDRNNYRYRVQLNLYKFILEKNYGIRIHKMYLVYFHPENISYNIVQVQDKKVTKHLNLAKDWSMESKGIHITRKRKRDLMDDSDPLKYMAGAYFAKQNNLTASRSGKRHKRLLGRSRSSKRQRASRHSTRIRN